MTLPPALAWHLLDAAGIGMLITDARRHILYVNKAFTQETGYALEEVVGRSCSFLQGPATDQEDVRVLRSALDRGEAVQRVILNYRKNGEVMWYKLRIQPVHEAGELRYFMGVQEDYSEAHALQVELKRLAYSDALTGLGNRRAFDREMARHMMTEEPVTLLVLDINGFKQVNDQRGHLAGDRLLEQVGQRLSRSVGEWGSVFRLGGDEFAVLLPDDRCRHDLGETLRTDLEQLDGGTLRAGLGEASFPAEAKDVHDLMRLADQRMYSQKAETKR